MYGSDMDVARKLLPCSSHDIAKLEAWLADMAAQGFRLKKINYDMGVFEKRNPASMRYRLFVKPKDHWYVDGKPAAEPQLIAYMRELGWEYITKYNHILYFATEDNTVQEPDKDIRGMIQFITRRKHNSVIASSFILMMMVLFFLQIPMHWIVERGTGVALLVLITLVICLVQDVTQLRNLQRWRQIVAEDRLQSVEVNWQQGSKSHRTILAVTLLVAAIFFAGMFANIFVDLDELNRVQLSEYQGNINIQTLEKLYPQYRIENTMYSYVEKDFDVLSSIVLKTELFGKVYDKEQYLGRAEFNTIYFLTWHEVIAQRLAGDYMEWMNAHQSVVLPTYDIDYAAAYQSKHRLHVLLQNDNKLICIEYELGDNRLPQTAEQIVELYLSVVK